MKNGIMLRCGYADCDITPENAVPLIGFYREKEKSEGVLSPLRAQVTVWEDADGNRYVLTAIDSLGFTPELTDRLREKTASLIGTVKDRVMVCFSHTHAAPDAADFSTGYYGAACGKILAAAEIARDRMTPVRTGWGNGTADIGVNRRRPGKPIDSRLGVLKVCRRDTGALMLLVFRVTAHGNALKRDNNCISPDYFGAVRERAGERFGCPVMVIQGAAGNVAPRFFCSAETPVDAAGREYTRSATAPDDMAEEILRGADRAVDRIATGDHTIGAYSRRITLTSAVPDEPTANGVAKDALEFCGIDGTEWLAQTRRLREAGVICQKDDVEVQYFRVGEGCLCGVPYEIMNEFALRASDKLGDPFFYLNGYTNGCMTYFPTEEEFDRGGYEVYWSLLIYYVYFGRVFPFERDSAETLIDFAVKGYVPD